MVTAKSVMVAELTMIVNLSAVGSVLAGRPIAQPPAQHKIKKP